MKTNKKLTLKKEKIASLSSQEMNAIQGGKAAGSTKHNLTCGWCTNTTIDTGDIIKLTTQITPHL